MKPTSKNWQDPEEHVGLEELGAKLRDLELPGVVIAFDPNEAQRLGAFREDALSEEEAMESAMFRNWKVQS